MKSALNALKTTLFTALTVAATGSVYAADPAYFSKYEDLRMTRDARGVLVISMNSKGGAVTFNARNHEQFVDAFYDVSRDRGNKIVILTGAGGQWMADIDFGSFGDVSDPDVWSKIHDEGTQIVENIANIRRCWGPGAGVRPCLLPQQASSRASSAPRID